MFGIDISEHNGNINLSNYVGQFVIIRVGWGSFTADKKFVRNVQECKRLGIPFGVYHYSYALNPETAKREAEAVLKAIEPYKHDIKVGVWFDMEDADHWKVKHGFKIVRETIEPICYTFCKTVEDAGYYTGIYCSESWLRHLGESNKRFDKWVASWGTNNGTLQNNTQEYGTLHQYTSKPLDRNIMYAEISRYDTFAEHKPQAGVNGKPSSGNGSNGVVLKPIDEIAREVMSGAWGNGWNRENALKQAGYDYNAVQKRVNELAHEKKIEAVARDVIAGKYGNGWRRKRNLKRAGYDYNEVQKKVNELM